MKVLTTLQSKQPLGHIIAICIDTFSTFKNYDVRVESGKIVCGG